MYKYTKINGNGNNFLVLDNRSLELDDDKKSKLTLRDCDVKASIGADGTLFVEKSDVADFAMRIFNADGSEADMCGNGARCIARYTFDNNIAKETMSFETKAGIMKARIEDDMVALDMGIINMSSIRGNETIQLENRTLEYSYLTLGVPHMIIYADENNIQAKEEMMELGEKLSRYYKVFPEGTNVNFVRQTSDSSIEVITYERGVNDITDSCGTGSCAAAVITGIVKGIKNSVDVYNPGGVNNVKYEFSKDKMTCHVILTGKVKTVAKIHMLV